MVLHDTIIQAPSLKKGCLLVYLLPACDTSASRIDSKPCKAMRRIDPHPDAAVSRVATFRLTRRLPISDNASCTVLKCFSCCRQPGPPPRLGLAFLASFLQRSVSQQASEEVCNIHCSFCRPDRGGLQRAALLPSPFPAIGHLQRASLFNDSTRRHPSGSAPFSRPRPPCGRRWRRPRRRQPSWQSPCQLRCRAQGHGR